MYYIEVNRGNKEGIVKFSFGAIAVSTKCYWDPNKKIPSGTYSGCSKTTMATKLNSAGLPREAIYLPSVFGFHGIFIHMGTSALWSDGCIVIDELELLKIYNSITPTNGKNVTVKVIDK